MIFPLRPSSDRGPAFHLSETADWPALLQSRANVLVCGVAEATESFLHKALPYLGTPLQNIACEEGIIIAADAITVVLRNVEILTGAEQRMLLDWIDHQPDERKAQIISVTPAPLYAYMQAQVFAEALYYRLNAIYLEVFPGNG